MRAWPLMIAVAALVVPAAAQLPSTAPIRVDPADVLVAEELSAAVAAADIGGLDQVLAKLPRPTQMRGVVQTYRAFVLAKADRYGEAVQAVEEALRLLPGRAEPKLAAFPIFTYNGAPQRAADLWMELSRDAPEMARAVDRGSINALIGRLEEIGDTLRADRVDARLRDIGYSASLANERARSAAASIRVAIAAGRIDEALAAVPAVTDPYALRQLYIDRRYEMLWPRIAQWSGLDLSGQSRRYLEELRADWVRSGEFSMAAAYARQLALLHAHAAVVALFKPALDRPDQAVGIDDADRLAPLVAQSLAELGRLPEAEALLTRVAAALPADYGTNSLNIDGARVRLAATMADWPQVVRRADAFLAAVSAAPDVNAEPIIVVKAYRACALSHLGRAREAMADAADVVSHAGVMPGPVMQLHTCRGDVPAARALVIASLGNERTRAWALAAMQPSGSDPILPLARLMKLTFDRVRAAPDAIAAANKVGRVLDRPIANVLPSGFDPLAAQPQLKSPSARLPVQTGV